MSIAIDPSTDQLLLGEETFPLVDSVRKMAEFYNYYESGFKITDGSGVIFHRKGFGSEQIVYQFAPQFCGVGYGQYENDPNMKVFNIPFPYRILLIAYEGGTFKGVRHFFSPHPITSLDDQLCMPSLPNTNCLGYRSNSLGWVCIYHQTSGNGLKTLQEKVDYALSRYDPIAEPYNYDNMGSTDGFKFYGNHKKYAFLYKPADWEKKGEEEGLDWVTGEDLWIPAAVAKTDTYGEKYAAKGEPYTLRRALFGPHYVYYSTQGAVLLNRYQDIKDDSVKLQDFVTTQMRSSIVGGAIKASKPKPPVIPVEDRLNGLAVSAMFTEDTIRSMMKQGTLLVCIFCLKKNNYTTFDSDQFVVANLSSAVYLSENIDLHGHYYAGVLCDDCLSQYGYYEADSPYEVSEMHGVFINSQMKKGAAKITSTDRLETRNYRVSMKNQCLVNRGAYWGGKGRPKRVVDFIGVDSYGNHTRSEIKVCRNCNQRWDAGGYDPSIYPLSVIDKILVERGLDIDKTMMALDEYRLNHYLPCLCCTSYDTFVDPITQRMYWVDQTGSTFLYITNDKLLSYANPMFQSLPKKMANRYFSLDLLIKFKMKGYDLEMMQDAAIGSMLRTMFR